MSSPPTDEKQSLRPHPPRLQHSPSMPNIWFPPHSGPIPPRLTEASGKVLERPATPPSSTDPNTDAQTVAEDPKLNIRRRINYDQPAVLLTPPLTPSSSIRTAGSIESSASYNTSLTSLDSASSSLSREQDIAFTDSDTISTRFLLVKNVSRKVTSEVLQFAILRALSAPKLAAPVVPSASTSLVPSASTSLVLSSSTALVPASNPRAPVSDTIKGVFLRYHESHGIAILAFYDVRQAKSALHLLSTPTTGTLSDCVDGGGEGKWLECAFVTAPDLAHMVGKSAFLAETQGLFLLQANVVGLDTSGSEKRVIDIVTLINVLQGHGAVRSFGLAQEFQQTASCKTFRIEYYDVKEANAASEALHTKVFFGMYLTILGPDPRALEPPAITSCIPFPTSQAVVPLEPASQRLTIETEAKVRPRSVSVGHQIESSAARPAPSDSADSPPYFYTSPSTSPSDVITPQTPDSHSRKTSNHLLFDAVGRPDDGSAPSETLKRPRSVSLDSVASPGQQGDADATPRKAVDAGAPAEYHRPPFYPPPPFYNGCPTPPLPAHFPYGYHPYPIPLAASGFPTCPPSPYGYEYDPAHAVMGPWLFEQAMMVPAGAYPGVPYSPINASPVNEYWQGPPPPPVPQHTSYFHHPPPPNPQGALPLQKLQSSPHLPFALSPTLSSPTTPSSRALTGPIHGPPSTASAAERNQLNLSRIEDGQDTRTTVMIKNIPNKMSDRDLMTYIGNVCPRKIDFLYLRMDFKNGCNVGYAFVNFISVQDLLQFAKAKLGEKWNMFSSEKVLQMSYANYQGKEALVEKFKNSCIMDEIPAWRPKIFYSEPGPEQGLPEPFPAPTHMKRKERSSYNRGPLYVPGMMNGLSHNRRQQPGDAERQRDRAVPLRQGERPRRFWDADQQTTPLTLADHMALISLGKMTAKK
ncbi:RNA recognition motif 2-domain-containing protein [Roridomyces roridus]|uniref:RNA recognition motif 2-domain-containing protein n=1 Tax=Roridomyces roridus TaxID=1738132 RepID=A0AAD7FWR2_9AGAR|nr:RNA recognition motif 2-domain-containing protein [Roridomyces roridus]